MIWLWMIGVFSTAIYLPMCATKEELESDSFKPVIYAWLRSMLWPAYWAYCFGDPLQKLLPPPGEGM